MSENIGDLSITIRVNKQTGELEVLKGQVTDTGKAIEGLGQSSTVSSEQLAGLASNITKLVSATAVLAFFKEAVAEANEEAEALRHLKAQMDALGLSYDQHQTKIEAWVASMEELAHLHGDVAYDALGKTLQRTGDLAASMRIIQLAQDIFIATGRDFNTTLENLSVAAGGSSRGLSQLQIQFGQQIASANTAKEAIQVLANNYGGAAEKAKGLGVASLDSSIQINKVYEKVGKELTPALQFLSDYALKPVVQSLLTIEVVLKTVATAAIASVVGATTVIWTSVKSVSSVMTAFVKDDWKGFNEAIKNGFSEMRRVGSEQTSILVKTFREGGKETSDIWHKSAGEVKSALESLKDIPVGPGKKETQEALDIMNQSLADMRRIEAQELSDKMLSEDEKIAIIQRYKQMEVDIIMATSAQIGDAEVNSIGRITQAYQESENKIRQIKQQNLENWKQGLNSWVAYNTQVDARLVQIGKQTADQLANNFGTATAKMIMHGDSFTKSFEAMFRNLTEQVIAQITAMIAKWAVLNALTGGGVSFGKVLGLAEGGRVYNPTYALIGEGGEPESVVPDSKAKDFARGVLAGGGGGAAASSFQSSSAQGGGGVNVVLNMGGVTINVGAGASGGDASNLAAQLIKGLNEETADYVRLALLSDNVATKYSGRAV